MDLLHVVSDVALRHLPKNWFGATRAAYFGARKKLYPLARAIHGSFDTAALRTHLEEKIDPDFEILMVHSSVNHMVPYYQGDPMTLLHMLIEFCGPDRTLAMPAFYFGNGRHASVHAEFGSNPEAVLNRLPSQMGLLTELFRRSRGVVQSRHPVYRISALGPLAQALVEGHENAQRPAGEGTPFEFMAARKTRIIGIGKSYHVMTQVHHVDDIMGESFPVPREKSDQPATEVTVVDGSDRVQVSLPRGGFTHRFNIAQLPNLLDGGEMSFWKFHNVPMFSASAAEVTQKLVLKAKQGATLYDPV